MRKHLLLWVLAAVLALAPVAALAAEKCWRAENLPHDQEFEETDNGERKWLGKGMSDREYAEFIDSMDGPIGRCLIADIYFSGDGFPKDYAKVAEILLGNNIRFCTGNFVHLGAMLKHGLGVAKDTAKADYWFRAYFASSPERPQLMQDSEGLIKDVQSKAGVSLKPELVAAHKWREKMLEEPPEKLYERGMAYLKTGEAVAGFPLADAMLRQAAKSGHLDAALIHARFYLDCKIGAYSRSPRSYLTRFAEAGSAEAATFLGLHYAKNTSINIFTHKRAKRWLTKALAGELPDDLRAEAKAVLAEVNTWHEKKYRRHSQ